MLESKLTEAKSKKDTLKARAKSAQTSRQINDMIQGLNTSNAMTAFDRMEEKVMSLEAESDATLQVRIPLAWGLLGRLPLPGKSACQIHPSCPWPGSMGADCCRFSSAGALLCSVTS